MASPAFLPDPVVALRLAALAMALSGLALVLAGLAWREVLRLSGGVDVVPIGRTASLAAAAGIAMTLLQGTFLSPADALVPAAVLVLVAATLVDRNLAWAPDSLMVPLAAFCGGIAALRTGLPVWVGILSGPLLLMTLHGLDALLRPRWSALPPPPDLLAFLAGPALFGFGPALLAVLALAMLALLAIRLYPPLIRIVARPEAAEAAREDLGYAETAGLAVPLLGILFPIYAAGLAVSTVVSAELLPALPLFFSQLLR